VPRAGFETTIPLGHTNFKYVRAAALDGNGQIIGSTGICDTITGKVVDAKHSIEDTGSGGHMVVSGDSGSGTFSSVRSEVSSSWAVILFWFGIGLALWYVCQYCLSFAALLSCILTCLDFRYRRKDVITACCYPFRNRSRYPTSSSLE
jgi:hypothetical protein